MRAGTLVLLVFSAVAAVVIASSVTSADNHVVYGCFLNNGEVFWDGYGHPAAFEGFGGPYVLGAILGPECDEYPSRADYEDKRIWSPEYQPTTPTPVPPTPTPVPHTPTPVPPTPTPLPTPTPVPTAVPTAVPDAGGGPEWPFSPYCFWNDRQTVLYCYG
jgi:cell division septation protein DedD